MPLTFEVQPTFLDGKTQLQVEIPAQISPKQLNILITPFYVSIAAQPTHLLLYDLTIEVGLENYTCKFKKGILTIELNNNGINSRFETKDEEALLKRRNESFFMYQKFNADKQKQQQEVIEKNQRESEFKEAAMKTQERLKLQQEKDEEKERIKQQINEVQQIKQEQTVLTEIRSKDTVELTTSFTKRKLAVPARDGRDMYADDQIGPIIPDVKKKSPQEQLEQAKNFIRQKRPDYESAIDVIKNLLHQAPLYIEALVLLAQILLKTAKIDECLQITAQLVKLMQNKHELQTESQQVMQFSKQMHSQVNSLHGAALASVGKYVDAWKYMDAAYTMCRENVGLKRDVELLKRIIATIE